MWITPEEYAEVGASIANRKCMRYLLNSFIILSNFYFNNFLEKTNKIKN